MNNRDLILVMLNQVKPDANRSTILWGSVKLVKAIFLCQSALAAAESEVNFAYHFYRWDYGPFDADIYRDLDFLSLGQQINRHFHDGISLSGSIYTEHGFSLTDPGKSLAQRLESQLTEATKNEINEWVNFVCVKTRDALLDYVYTATDLKKYQIGDLVQLPRLKTKLG